VINASTNAVVASVPVGAQPFAWLLGVAVNPSGSLVYVTNASENTVAVIYAPTNTVIANVPVGSKPVGVAADPTGMRVLVGNEVGGTVSVIDAATNRVMATVPVGSNPDAFGAFVAGAPIAAPSCNDQIAPLLQQIDALQRQLAAANATIVDLTAENTRLRSQNAALQNQVASLQQQLAAANAAILDLNSQVTALKAQVASLEQHMAYYATLKPGQYQQLMHEIRKAYESAQRLLGR
jgi:YVTN family beta-propeller protein